MEERTPLQIAMNQLHDALREEWQEEIVEHVDHILSRVRTRVWELTEASDDAAVLVANAIDDVLSNKDR